MSTKEHVLSAPVAATPALAPRVAPRRSRLRPACAPSAAWSIRPLTSRGPPCTSVPRTTGKRSRPNARLTSSSSSSAGLVTDPTRRPPARRRSAGCARWARPRAGAGHGWAGAGRRAAQGERRATPRPRGGIERRRPDARDRRGHLRAGRSRASPVVRRPAEHGGSVRDRPLGRPDPRRTRRSRPQRACPGARLHGRVRRGLPGRGTRRVHGGRAAVARARARPRPAEPWRRAARDAPATDRPGSAAAGARRPDDLPEALDGAPAGRVRGRAERPDPAAHRRAGERHAVRRRGVEPADRTVLQPGVSPTRTSWVRCRPPRVRST